ncbi:MAG TPA: hypothetical protein VK946_03480 [Methylotenera sp.]|nr:hypothetical protein [Methylotenera sp.]
MKLLTSVFFALTIVFSSFAHARNTVPVINHDNINIVTSDGKVLQAIQIKQAIEAAANKNDWTITNGEDGKLLAKILVRNKHTVVIEITYDTSKYSINYKDSNNMKYEVQSGQAMIHPFYNKWVDLFKNSINAELAKL